MSEWGALIFFLHFSYIPDSMLVSLGVYPQNPGKSLGNKDLFVE